MPCWHLAVLGEQRKGVVVVVDSNLAAGWVEVERFSLLEAAAAADEKMELAMGAHKGLPLRLLPEAIAASENTEPSRRCVEEDRIGRGRSPRRGSRVALGEAPAVALPVEHPEIS